MKKFYTTLMMIGAIMTAGAQVVTTQPAILQPSSRNIVVTFHADQGNKGLQGVTSGTDVYAHTGVILQGSDKWSCAPSWGDNSAKYKMSYAGQDTWTLTIPSIAAYYGLSESEVAKVTKLAFVFRTADNSKEAKGDNNSDIFINVEPDGYAMNMSYNPDSKLITQPTLVTFTVNVTEPSVISLSAETNQRTANRFAQSDGYVKSFTYSYNITEKGNTTITANAVSESGASKQISVDFTYANESVEMAYPGGVPKMGPVAHADGSVTFCIAAPEKKSVMLIGDWNDFAYTDFQTMRYQDYQGYRYFWLNMPGLADGNDHIYYFLVDNTIAVADPYAELILDPFSDKYIPESVYPNMPKYPSEFVSNTPVGIYNSSMNDYDWEVTDFKGVDPSALVVYELLIRDFTGTEGASDANGTVQGVINRLDYLKTLGVNAVELLPIMEFNGNNSWGYNTNFYFAPDKAYGTPNDYRRLIDECHKRGMAVILDIVFNQTDGLHPWYMMYPISKNPFYNGTAPHAYSVLNDWNQDNPLVQQQFKDAVKYWLKEYKVDGYRFDLVKGLGSNQSYNATYDAANNTWSNVTDWKTNDYNASRVARMKELHDAMREVNPDAYFINENLAGAKEENQMAEDGELNWANINHQCCNFASGISSDSNMARFYAPLDDNRIWGSTVSYAESHDEERMAYYISKNGVSGVKGNTRSTMRRLSSVAAMMLMTPGAHMIWQFQEFGADQTTKEPNGGNDTSPKKVVWNLLNNTNNAGLLKNYTELCRLRQDNPELFVKGINTTTIACNTTDWGRGRYITLKSGDKALYLVVNPQTSATIGVPLSGANSSDQLQLMSCSNGTTPKLSGTTVTLQGGAYAIYGTKNLVSSDQIKTERTAIAKAYGADGRIIIVGNYNNADAYTITGRKVDIACNLAPGFYVVNIDGISQKVAVR